ncbi:MAG: DUF72 domain-containing protein [Desulfobacterales bacterium]
MVRIGCCGFAKAQDKYFAAFRALEVQKTFYQPPKTATLARWRHNAPENFEFTVKAWQLITHRAASPTYRRIKTPLSEQEKTQAGDFQLNALTRQAWEKTLACARALHADKILFQCPASFQPTDENMERVARFFRAVDTGGYLLLFEPRGKWQDTDIDQVCRISGLYHAVDPFKRNPVTSGIRYYRLHGISGYYHRYTAEELKQLRSMLSSQNPNYCFFNNVSMFEDAAAFQQLIGKDVQ